MDINMIFMSRYIWLQKGWQGLCSVSSQWNATAKGLRSGVMSVDVYQTCVAGLSWETYEL